MLHDRLHKKLLVVRVFPNVLDAEHGQVLHSDPLTNREINRRVLSVCVARELSDSAGLLQDPPGDRGVRRGVAEAYSVMRYGWVEVDPLADFQGVLQMVDLRPPI